MPPLSPHLASVVGGAGQLPHGVVVLLATAEPVAALAAVVAGAVVVRLALLHLHAQPGGHGPPAEVLVAVLRRRALLLALALAAAHLERQLGRVGLARGLLPRVAQVGEAGRVRQPVEVAGSGRGVGGFSGTAWLMPY